MTEYKRTIFLTGATGLVGSYLLKILLKNGHKVFVLARSKGDKKAGERVKEALNFWDKNVYPECGKNLIVLEGDITEKNLGLTENNLTKFKDEVEEIFHCAASIAFNIPLDKMRDINVEGTRRILDLALKVKNLKKINHISTAYVCGNCKSTFKEGDLHVGQGFNSNYEQSKFEGEGLIADYRRNTNLWIDIFRPCIVIGESKTGRLPISGQAFYQIMRVWISEVFDYFPGGSYSFNLVPVDELSVSIYTIAFNANIRNNNYHVFRSRAIPLPDLLDFSSRFLGFKKPELIRIDEFLEKHSSPVLKSILKNSFYSFNGEVKLESETTEEVLKRYNFRYSELNEDFMSKILNLLKK